MATEGSQAKAGKVKSPSSLAHVVLGTNNFSAMVEFYEIFLGATIVYQDEILAFLTYDDEHHRIAIAGIPGTTAKSPMSCGLRHIAFTFDSLEDLTLAYKQRKAHGILPNWSVNHGPTTSIYYLDPDGNQLETQVDNFDNPQSATDFMLSPLFRENPIGTDFDPEDLIRRIESGESVESIKRRKEVGARKVVKL